jgi:tetratricopeptide (TPR) repeat protein
VYDQQGKHQEAFDAYTQAAQPMQEFKDDIGLGKALVNRAIVLGAVGRLPDALQEVQQAVGILEQTQDQVTLEWVQGLLGHIANAPGTY